MKKLRLLAIISPVLDLFFKRQRTGGFCNPEKTPTSLVLAGPVTALGGLNSELMKAENL